VSEAGSRVLWCKLVVRSDGRLAEACGKLVVKGSAEGSGEWDGERGLVVEGEQVRSGSLPSSEGSVRCHARVPGWCQEEDGELGAGQVSQGIAWTLVHRMALGPCISQKVARES